MKGLINYLTYFIFLGALGLFNTLPLSIRLRATYLGIRLYAFLSPRFQAVCLKNLSVVYPKASAREMHDLLIGSYRSLARFIIDTARFHLLNKHWVESHIDCPFAQEYLAIKARYPGKGILTASGHIGSIELQALAAPFVGRKFSFVARSLKHPLLDKWWKANRQMHGNEVISRTGAVKKIIRNLNNGIDVAILIDQNVKSEYAIFVDWFGIPAATTFAFGHAAVKTRCPIVLSAISYIGNERYQVREHECDVSAIHNDESLSDEAKVTEITKKVSTELQKMILERPTEWFWMHRRWKTRPPGEPENFYS